MKIILIFFIAHWYLSLFSQSFFDHRYAAHRDFTMNKFWERFFYIFTYITQGASYMSPRAYAIMHRMHHAYTDTENDPHSPRHSKGVIDMMLRTNKIYLGILKGTIVPEPQFTKLVPDWPAFDRFAVTYASSIFWTILYVIFYINYAPNYWWFLLIPIHVLMGPIHGTIINWFAHKYGYKNFEMDNTARNLMPVDIFMIGEGYHNNHHKFSTRANFGYHWYEIDPVYWVILFLNMLGIIQLKKESKAFVENVF